ncbi:MAG: chemotaxis protein [Gallionellaceae bacterium]|nr:chemotaxis protein [Gallionellaceae bacterium]
MSTYLVTIGLILLLLLGWIVVQRVYRLFARRHPELGPFRAEGGGCGCCSQGDACGGGACDSGAGRRQHECR